MIEVAVAAPSPLAARAAETVAAHGGGAVDAADAANALKPSLEKAAAAAAKPQAATKPPQARPAPSAPPPAHPAGNQARS